ncbi:unnamed protein product [Psylliodes chrysocephalus]|uniref:Uncharacterized protein n=1 Tax=Psylliodes chrysocephalus TaxID=3402493 RepID=A0A9P0CI90_9CUCU|nr:unnamed protein product [Psylliodes chrysocephala]
MKNSSDIFFLKESENPSNDLWSIKGISPMKIRRRPSTAQNDCFEYGRNVLNGSDMDKAVEKNEVGEIPSNEDQAGNAGKPAVGTISNIECRQQKSLVKKTVPRQSDEVSSSNMARNPITGLGMDINEYKFPKL